MFIFKQIHFYSNFIQNGGNYVIFSISWRSNIWTKIYDLLNNITYKSSNNRNIPCNQNKITNWQDIKACHLNQHVCQSYICIILIYKWSVDINIIDNKKIQKWHYLDVQVSVVHWWDPAHFLVRHQLQDLLVHPCLPLSWNL